MPRRRTSPALVVALLAAVLAVSIPGGWFIAGQVAGGEPGVRLIHADPAEPPYDGGDPAPAPSSPSVTTASPHAAAALPAEVIAPPAPAPAPTGPASVRAPTAITAPVPVPPRAAATTPAAPPADPGPSLAPYDPPPAIGIAAEALPAEGRAWTMLITARRAAPAGSQERTDLDWLMDFGRVAASPDAPGGRRMTARRALRINAWWYAGRSAPTERVIARDPDGILLTYKRGHGFMVNPVATIGRWRGLNEPWSPALLAEALLPMLAAHSRGRAQWGALEYFDVPGDPAAVRPGVSGMAQARATSLFAKAWAATGDPRFLDAARDALAAFGVPVDDGGVQARVRDPDGGAPGTWYPERAHTGGNPWLGGALNGFMVTLIELEHAASAFAATPEGAAAAERARVLADQGRRSLVRFLPLHDSGDWSYYGLLTPGLPWRSYLADLNYHCYHVSLLRTLHTLHPADGLGRVADRWQAYVDARGAECPVR